LQQHTEVYFDVAGVGAQGFLRGRLVEATGDEIADELFVEIAGEAFQPSANGGFMDVKGLSDLGKSLAVEIVGGEQKAVFRSYTSKGAGNGRRELGQFGGDLGGGRRRRTVDTVEGRFAIGAAVVVSRSLDEGGAEPREKRAAAGVRGQR
jgi:hypothetical protein